MQRDVMGTFASALDIVSTIRYVLLYRIVENRIGYPAWRMTTVPWNTKLLKQLRKPHLLKVSQAHIPLLRRRWKRRAPALDPPEPCSTPISASCWQASF